MKNKTCIISGHSGVGKSTLVNSISPNLQLKTKEISYSNNQGKHTTTYAEMFDLDFNIRVIDTPGIRGFGLVDISKYEGVISPDYRVFNLIDNTCDKDYILLLLQIGYKHKIFYAHGQGVSMLGRWRFPADNFNNFRFPIPPLSEQKEISAYIENASKKIETAINLKQKEIEKLKEYKSSLINSVVTGKVKVC